MGVFNSFFESFHKLGNGVTTFKSLLLLSLEKFYWA